uniref:Serine/threonine-protein phosphatase 4 regulatory subunit 3-like central domain-containing protein n=1 Tax=Picocystis salinarum TaxID=88271 RepID=A0A6U9QNZ0_9CHLO|mmetsp:Transcript_8382/g.52385  ORF Transcript_8382/g.52385 Transcript_8382/m.52385 type:complete len:742 (-) Transcript_8382:998-3223(-)
MADVGRPKRIVLYGTRLQTHAMRTIRRVLLLLSTPLLGTHRSWIWVWWGNAGDSIITWTDADLGAEIALSFQDAGGCGYVWEQIAKYQAHAQGFQPPHGVDEYEQLRRRSEGSQEFLQRRPAQQPTRLPEPSTSNLCRIEEVIRENSLFTREGLVVQLLHEGYLRKVLDVFRDLEDLEDGDRLKTMHAVIQNIFLLNDAGLIEAMLCEENIMDVMGALEYDPTISKKPEHRNFLKEKVMFKEVVPIHDVAIKAKIHQAYHIGYVKDVVLPRVLDDATFGTLSSMVLFNNMDVVVALHNDQDFVQTLFQKVQSYQCFGAEWLDLVGFLRELCSLARHLQPSYQTSIFNKLIQFGLFDCLGQLLDNPADQAKRHGLDILQSLMQHDPLLLKRVLLEEKGNKLFGLLIGGLTSMPKDSGIAWQVVEIVKLLLDPESSDSKDDQNKFLEFFYGMYLGRLVDMLAYESTSTEILLLIMELLSFCVQYHSIRAQYFVLQNDVFDKVLHLLLKRDKVLPVAAVRFLRACIGLKEKFYISHIISRRLFDLVMEVFQKNGHRYNLLNSVVLELLEFIKHENIAPLVAHVVECYDSMLSSIDYVETYRQLKARARENRGTFNEERQEQLKASGTGHEGREEIRRCNIEGIELQCDGQCNSGEGYDGEGKSVEIDGGDAIQTRREENNLAIPKHDRPGLQLGLVSYEDDDSDDENGAMSGLCTITGDKRLIGDAEIVEPESEKKSRKENGCV